MPKFRTLALPVLTAVLTLGFTGFIWQQLHSQHMALREARFNQLSFQIRDRLQQQLDNSQRLLHSAQSHYASGGTDLAGFLSPQLGTAGLAGLQSLSQAPLIQPEQLETFIASQGQLTGTEFSIRTPGERPLYAPVISALSSTGSRVADKGVDLFADPEQQPTLTRARDSGVSTLSGRLMLKGSHAELVPGFIIAIPLFAPGQKHDTMAERRTHLQGWAVAAFNSQEWVRETVGALSQDLDLRITESQPDARGEALYPPGNDKPVNAAEGLVSQHTLKLGDNSWHLQISAQPAFIENLGGDPAKPAALLGVILTGILIYLSLLLSSGKLRLRAENERLQEALQEAEERWRFALEGSGDGVWDWDIKTGSVSFSPRCDAILGVADGHASQARIHPEDETSERAAMQACLEGKTSQYTSEHRMQGEDGQWRWVAARGMVVARTFTGAAARMIGTMSDITERKTAHDLIQGMAQVDAQTGLPNRTLFFDRLQQALRMAKRKRETLGLLCVDIDQFKAVNDNFGQAVGNKLLRAVADRLVEVMRDSDTVAHFGSDDFSILLPALASEEDAHLVTDKLLNAFNNDFVINNRHINIRISVGAALFPQHARSAETLLNSAQRAVQQATKSGGNTACFSLNTGK